MSTPNVGHSGDEYPRDRDVTSAGQITLTRPRPNYAQLRADYYHIMAEGLHKKTLNWRQARAWAQARQNFEDALIRLLPKSGLGRVILDPADIRTELVRVTNTIICLHDWLRLYQEIIKQPPPEGLLLIDGRLCERHNELNPLTRRDAYQLD
jgi:hypothetical protein